MMRAASDEAHQEGTPTAHSGAPLSQEDQEDEAVIESPAGRSAVRDSNLGIIVGRNTKRVRQERGISLTELARKAGVARATLHQLEAGAANPTLETMNSVATLLGITLGDLVTDMQPPDSHLVRRVDAQVLNSPGVEARLMRRFNVVSAVIEIYHIGFQPHHTLTSPGHQLGVVEHVLVHEGRLTTGPSDGLQVLEPGDYMTYRGDLPHSYSTDEVPASATLLMQYPQE